MFPHRYGRPRSTQATPATVEQVRKAIQRMTNEKPPGALLSVRELRGRLALDKDTFDEAVLALHAAARIVLHHHDFPASLGETERGKLVRDARGVHYVGLALRRGA